MNINMETIHAVQILSDKKLFKINSAITLLKERERELKEMIESSRVNGKIINQQTLRISQKNIELTRYLLAMFNEMVTYKSNDDA